jgi:hypothetical protein
LLVCEAGTRRFEADCAGRPQRPSDGRIARLDDSVDYALESVPPADARLDGVLGIASDDAGIPGIRQHSRTPGEAELQAPAGGSGGLTRPECRDRHTQLGDREPVPRRKAEPPWAESLNQRPSEGIVQHPDSGNFDARVEAQGPTGRLNGARERDQGLTIGACPECTQTRLAGRRAPTITTQDLPVSLTQRAAHNGRTRLIQ